MMTFNAKLYSIGKWTILRLPENASLELPSRGQVMVRGTINNQEFNRVLEPDGRWGHWVKIDQTLQKKLGVKAGDSVTLNISPSKDWPEPDIPKDFANKLAGASDKVKELWKKITPMARWEWIRWVNATGVMETRERRIDVSISKLQSGKRRPCCFNLAACTDPDLSKNSRLIEPIAVT
jgi:hypothetical protein